MSEPSYRILVVEHRLPFACLRGDISGRSAPVQQFDHAPRRAIDSRLWQVVLDEGRQVAKVRTDEQADLGVAPCTRPGRSGGARPRGRTK